MLAAILLDLVRERAANAPSMPLPPSAINPGAEEVTPPMSEQVVMIFTLLDTLPFIAVELLEEWLPLLPGTLQVVADDGMRDQCIKYLWETLVGGSMDPERSQICVAWWTTGGGKDDILYGCNMHMMSGALDNMRL